MTPVRLSRFLLCPVCWALLVLASATVDAAAEPLGHLLLKRAALIAISPKGQATPGWRPLVASPSPAVKVQPNGHRGPALVDGTRGPVPPPPLPRPPAAFCHTIMQQQKPAPAAGRDGRMRMGSSGSRGAWSSACIAWIPQAQCLRPCRLQGHRSAPPSALRQRRKRPGCALPPP